MKNKVVIITGASSGIGKACALEFAARGAHLILGARNMEALNDLKGLLEAKGREVKIIQTDVTREEDCRILIQTALDAFGKIDILVNNAGISMRALFTDAKVEVIRQVMDVNFWGTVYATKYALPHLLASKGSLVGISSIAGFKGLPARTGYSASKFAMQGFLESIRIENLKKGLHVLIACPGFTASNIRSVALKADGTPQGTSPRTESKIMQAEEVAEHLARAIISRKRQLVLTTQGRLLVFLNKFFPSWMDRMTYKSFEKEADSPLR